MKIYVASSWCNEQQPQVVQVLRDAGHVIERVCSRCGKSKPLGEYYKSCRRCKACERMLARNRDRYRRARALEFDRWLRELQREEHHA